MFVSSSISLCRKQHLPKIRTLFCLVDIKKRSFLISCVLIFFGTLAVISVFEVQQSINQVNRFFAGSIVSISHGYETVLYVISSPLMRGSSTGRAPDSRFCDISDPNPFRSTILLSEFCLSQKCCADSLSVCPTPV